MAIKESALTEMVTITNNDLVRVVSNAGASRIISVFNLAYAVVEGYTGSSLAGSTRSIKSAIDDTEIDSEVTTLATSMGWTAT